MIFGLKDAAPLGFKPIDGGHSIDSSMGMRGLSLAIRPRARRPIALLKQDTSDHPITFPVTPDTPRCSTPGTESTELDLISPESPPKRRKMFHHHSPPKKPNPSQIPNTPITASARAENALPNVDGVVDAPASVAAF